MRQVTRIKFKDIWDVMKSWQYTRKRLIINHVRRDVNATNIILERKALINLAPTSKRMHQVNNCFIRAAVNNYGYE